MMKLRCHRPSLAAAFQVVSGVVPTRTPKEILKNVKLHVGDGKATLIGTDQEVGIRYEIQGVETDSYGETLLPTNRVISILREVRGDDVEIEVTEEAIWVRSGHSEFRLSAEDPAEFPTVPEFDEEAYFIIPGQQLRDIIRRTVFATDAESSRFAMGGVKAELETDGITMIATDARRMAVVKTVCGSDGMEELENAEPIIPAKALQLLERSIGNDEDDVLMAVHANDALFKCPHCTIYSRLVDGRFPNWKNALPKSCNVEVELIADPFHSAVRQSQIVTNEETRGVDFKFSDGLLTLVSRASDVGESKIELPVSYDYDEMTITFEPSFLNEFLRVLEPEKKLQLSLVDAEQAAVFRTDDNYTYIVMPFTQNR